MIGPVAGAQGDANRRQFFATDIALAHRGYVEQEFFLEGRTDAYDTPSREAMMRAEITDRPAAIKREDGPCRTRMILRRPTDPTAFNGTVVVAWRNVTDDFDGDHFWIQAQKHLLRDGYA